MSLEEKKAKVLACCEQWFDTMDTNGDGFLDHAEGENFYRTILLKEEDAHDVEARAASKSNRIFEHCDTNADGKVSKAEMLAVFKAMSDDVGEEQMDELIERYETTGRCV